MIHALILLSLLAHGAPKTDPASVSFMPEPGRVRILLGGREVAQYVYQDDKILRPFFCQVKTARGMQVTRNHPPIAGKDALDHDTMHPGIWLAFGDLSGNDYWRNTSRVQHEKFLEAPLRAGSVSDRRPPVANAPGSPNSFVVSNRYLAKDGKTVLAREECGLRVVSRPLGWLLVWESRFRPEQGESIFGDQEEMGFGVRLATALTVKAGGTILNSEGRKNEREVWGRAADWCDYGGELDGRRVGVVVMPAPDQYRRSWFHARDYGLLVANPFGRRAFTGGEISRVVVRPDESLRLQFGVFVYDVAQGSPFDASVVYRDFLDQIKPPASSSKK